MHPAYICMRTMGCMTGRLLTRSPSYKIRGTVDPHRPNMHVYRHSAHDAGSPLLDGLLVP